MEESLQPTRALSLKQRLRSSFSPKRKTSKEVMDDANSSRSFSFSSFSFSGGAARRRQQSESQASAAEDELLGESPGAANRPPSPPAWSRQGITFKGDDEFMLNLDDPEGSAAALAAALTANHNSSAVELTTAWRYAMLLTDKAGALHIGLVQALWAGTAAAAETLSPADSKEVAAIVGDWAALERLQPAAFELHPTVCQGLCSQALTADVLGALPSRDLGHLSRLAHGIAAGGDARAVQELSQRVLSELKHR